MLKYMEEYINNEFDEEQAQKIILNADNELQQLIAKCKENSKNRRNNLYKSIYPSISTYHSMQRYMDKNKAFEHMDKMISYNANNNTRKFYERIGKLPFFFGLFRKMFSTGLKGDSWEVEWIANDKNGFEYNIKRCLWHEAFKQYHCPELCKLFCRNDEINFTDVSSRMRFERKGAIGYGDKICDFHFYASSKS